MSACTGWRVRAQWDVSNVKYTTFWDIAARSPCRASESRCIPAFCILPPGRFDFGIDASEVEQSPPRPERAQRMIGGTHERLILLHRLAPNAGRPLVRVYPNQNIG